MLRLLFIVIPCAVASAAAAESNWPQFRGPSGQGMSDVQDLPLQWSEHQNVKWKTAIHGKAWSSPAVWGGQVWMSTATPDGHELFAVCVDRKTGSIVYDRKLFDIPHPQYCIPFNSYASPSPCVEQGRAYVTFGSPGTACLDSQSGQVLWTRTDLICNHYRGAGSSPVLYKNLLIMNFDGSDYQYVIALNKSNGQTAWRTDRDVDYGDIESNGKPRAEGDFRKAFSTPRIFSINQKDVLVSLGSKAIYGYDPMTGRERWRIDVKDSFSGSDTPVFGDGMIFFTTGHGQSELLAVRPEGDGDLTGKAVVWRDHRHVPTRSSVLFVDGLLYMVSDAGVVTCLEAQSGKQVWSGRIDGEYSASPIYAAGRIYFFSEQGKTTVIAAGREFKVLAENQLEDGIMATPAVVDGALYLRTRTALYRIEK